MNGAPLIEAIPRSCFNCRQYMGCEHFRTPADPDAAKFPVRTNFAALHAKLATAYASECASFALDRVFVEEPQS